MHDWIMICFVCAGLNLSDQLSGIEVIKMQGANSFKEFTQSEFYSLFSYIGYKNYYTIRIT